MDQSRLDHLERLHKLRASGALEDDEFQAEKRKLLTDNEAPPPRLGRGWLYGIIAIAVSVGAISLGAWAIHNEQTPMASATRQQQSANVSDVVEPIGVHETLARSPADRLADAFEAATGHRSAFSKTEGGQLITTKPVRIVELPFGPALLTKREIKDGCHACTGAIGLYYLREQPEGTVVTGRWPKAVEGWGWGAAPTEWYLTHKFTAYPAVYASGGFMGQGIIEESATITELRPEGPITSDVIGTGFSDEGAIVDNERAPCEVKGTIANVRKDRSFDVLASGSVTAVDHYVKKQGKFVAASKIDWAVPCDRDPFRD